MVLGKGRGFQFLCSGFMDELGGSLGSDPLGIWFSVGRRESMVPTSCPSKVADIQVDSSACPLKG